MSIKVCHLSSAHPAKDVRIFHKQCASLAAHGYDVTLVVPDSEDHRDKEVNIAAVPKAAGRVGRMTRTAFAVFRRALAVDAELYHFHDPELFPAALALKAKGKRVIFDSHEDLPRQILSKSWIHPLLREPVAGAGEFLEDRAAKQLDAVVAATPTIGARFAALGVTTEVVNNYPILNEFSGQAVERREKKRQAVYIGSITAIRGAREMVAAIAHTNAQLVLCGSVEVDLQGELDAAHQDGQVVLAGILGRAEVAQQLADSMVGLCLLWPTPNYLESTPIKLFEYMAAGLPIVASDFPRWRELVGDSDAACFVDPKDPAAIAAAILSLLDDPSKAEAMGKRGRARVASGFHWGVEEAKLLALYARILGV